MNESYPKIIAFMNSYTQGKSGGDTVFIELAKKINNYNLLIITSLLGKELCQNNSVKAKYFITSSELKIINIINIYIKRTLKAFFLRIEIKEKDLFLSTSDFLPDVLPVFFLKIFHKKNRWIQKIFHLIPKTRKIPYFAQKISFFFIKKFADLIIVDNNLLKEELIKQNFNKNKLFVIYPGINIKYLKSIKNINNNDNYDCVFMAQLRISKGIFDLLDIWKQILNSGNFKLAIIGAGDVNIVNQIKQKIIKSNISKYVDLLGYIEDEKALSLIKSSKVFIFPSHEEGFGIAALQAQALGLPVVAWNLPVFNEIFSEGMIKIKCNDTKSFSKEVVKLLKDKAYYNIIAKAALSNALKYDLDIMLEKEIELFKNVNKK